MNGRTASLAKGQGIWVPYQTGTRLARKTAKNCMIVCVIYGITHWNRDDKPAKPEDIHWAQEEKEQVEKTL